MAHEAFTHHGIWMGESKRPCRIAICCLALLILSGCGRAGGGTRLDSPAAVEEESEATSLHLDQLRIQGQFAEFIAAARAAAERFPRRAEIRIAQAESLLATGALVEAERAALAAADAAACLSDQPMVAQSLRLWVIARFRRGMPLADPQFELALATLSFDEPGAANLRYWLTEFGDRRPYDAQAIGGTRAHELILSKSDPASVPGELRAIEARANGQPLPLVFVDTGAQHNLMTSAAAREAGVRLGPASTLLAGFADIEARLGVIETLELGGLVLKHVPVLVGHSVPLSAMGGQMALGAELMHHVRFSIDYPAGRAFIEPAGGPPFAKGGPNDWRIPLWTFSQVCLSQGWLDDHRPVRVLVDTGNRAGTFVSPRWARQHLRGLEPPVARLIFRHRPRDARLPALSLGDQALVDWPVVDLMPKGLDRLNLVDVLIGHDLIAPYRLSIDLRARHLELSMTSSSAGKNDGAYSDGTITQP